MYEIKGFKSFKGHEGEPCAQGTLALNGKKVAEWSDDSHGGPFRLEFTSEAARAAFLEHAKTYLATKKNYDGQPYDLTSEDGYLLESAAQEMSFEHQERQQLLRSAKKGICYKVLENGKVEVYTSTAAYCPKTVAHLEAKYGASLVEIVNKTLGLPMLDDATAKLAEDNARYKKLCKTKTIYSLRNADGTVAMMQSSRPYSAMVAASLRAQHSNLVEIVNERYL